MLKTAAPRGIISRGVLLLAAGLGVLASLAAGGTDGAGWILALLVPSAAVTAIAQQTLP